jgi:hypothetical protein
MKSNLAGLYIQIEAKKRRIKTINGGNPPKTGGTMERGCGAGTPARRSIKEEAHDALQSNREARAKRNLPSAIVLIMKSPAALLETSKSKPFTRRNE